MELKKLDPDNFVIVFTTAMFLDLMITNPRSWPENPLYNCIFILWKLVIESYINKQGKELPWIVSQLLYKVVEHQMLL